MLVEIIMNMFQLQSGQKLQDQYAKCSISLFTNGRFAIVAIDVIRFNSEHLLK